MQPQENDNVRIFAAIFLAAVLLIFWQAKVEYPRRQQLAQYNAVQGQQAAKVKAVEVEKAKKDVAEEALPKTHDERIAASTRVSINSGKLHGSIALKGARFDDLTLTKYRTELDPQSPAVTLFTPNGDMEAYFAQVGWVAQDGKTKVPDNKSVWQADKNELAAGGSVNLHWDNGEGVVYALSISLDNDYMFKIAQSVQNHSKGDISVAPYAFINRSYEESSKHYAMTHEGPLGVVDGLLKELPYKTLREGGNKEFSEPSSWVSISDKYWLAALIPQVAPQKTSFTHYDKAGQNRYQVDYLGQTQQVAAGASSAENMRMFAGAKEIDVLDRYTNGDGTDANPPILLFDRSVDFGMLYFLSKPLFLLLTQFYAMVGNFGIAIMLLTIVVKIFLYPLASKAFHATAQMRELQPEMAKLKERFPDDKLKLNQEVMALYKREKVNPASGCLPVLMQMPVFFALLKVLNVGIEMRHAPFFGWLKDMSAPDPSNLFTLFGVINWQPFFNLHLGILPIMMGITMFIQTRLQPKPTDPVQAKMMNIMPFLFLFMFASFPAGLVLYYVWSNSLSIIQQRVITYRYHKSLEKRGGKPTKAVA